MSDEHKTQLTKAFLKSAIRILQLLSFNSIEMIQKYVSEFGQFTEIINNLGLWKDQLGLNEDDCKLFFHFIIFKTVFLSVNKLSSLVINEEVLQISPNKFLKIDF